MYVMASQVVPCAIHRQVTKAHDPDLWGWTNSSPLEIQVYGDYPYQDRDKQPEDSLIATFN